MHNGFMLDRYIFLSAGPIVYVLFRSVCSQGSVLVRLGRT